MVKRKRAFIMGSDSYVKTIQLQLQQSGFEVTCFATGKSLIKQLSPAVDLVILDYNQGEPGTALEFLRKIKAIHRDMPVLFLLSPQDMQTASQALSFGAFFYIEKDMMFMQQLSYALDQLDVDKKRKFWIALRSFRKTIFRLYGFY